MKMEKIHMTPKKPVKGINDSRIHKNDEVIWYDKSTNTEYEGITTDIYPRSNTLIFHEINNEFEKRVDAYDCKPMTR